MGESDSNKLEHSFRQAWKLFVRGEGERPGLPGFLSSIREQRVDSEKLTKQILQFEISQNQLLDAPYAISRYISLCPDYESFIRHQFELQKELQKGTQDTLAPGVGMQDQPPVDATIGLLTGTTPKLGGESAVAPRVGQRFGHFVIEEEIARGGMGVVFRARDTRLDRECALKMILAGQFAGDVEVQRFYTEAQAAARLDHPGIVPVFEMGEIEGQHFFSMKYIDGGSLADQVQSLASDSQRAASMMIKVARAVHFAHQRGIMHRDLKPANILLDAESNPLVSDLGLAKNTQQDSGMTRTGAIVGTPAYMSPEQASGSPDITTAADIYSLGAVFFELLTGRPPYQCETPMKTILTVLDDSKPSIRACRPELDRDLDLIVQKCMAADPLARYPSASEFADDVENWKEGKPISLCPPNAAHLFSEWMSRNLKSVGGAVLTGLVLGLILGGTVWLSISSDVSSNLDAIYEKFPSEKKPFFSANSKLGNTFNAQTAWLLLPPIILVGLFTTWLTRPENRRNAITLGTIAGLVMAMTSFASGIGWGPLLLKTQTINNQNMQLLGQATSDDNEAREAAYRAMVRVYPDLARQDAGELGKLIAQKASADSAMAIPSALWMGMLAAILCCMLPAVLGTVFSAHLLSVNEKRRRTILPYLEVASILALAIIFFVMNFVARRMGANIIAPPLLWQIGLFVAIMLAVFVALKGAHWKSRTLAHLVWMVALGLYLVEIRQTSRTYEYAVQMLAEGKTREAAVRFERFLNNNPNQGNSRYHAALLQARLGNDEKYREHCNEMLDRFGRTFSSYIAEQTAKVCFLKPGAINDLSAAIELSEFALSESPQGNHVHYFNVTRALGAFRLGDFQSVEQYSSVAHETMAPLLKELAHLITAMANFRIQPNSTNAAALAKCVATAKQSCEQFKPRGIAADYFPDWLALQVISEEAGVMLDRHNETTSSDSTPVD